jgi:hypothetical protein
MRNIKISYTFSFILLLFIVYATPLSVFAQSSNTSSPYSRYGIGDLSNKGFAQGFAMGGSHIALQNDTTELFFINSGNPASYANFRLTTAELGLNYSGVRLTNNSTKQTVHNASLAYVSLAFPVKKWWGSSIGLLPYSSVGYAISDNRTLSSVGNVEYLYEGSGGVNQVYFGNSVKPLYGLPGAFRRSIKYAQLEQEKKYGEIRKIMNRKKCAQGLSLGFNASYLFGNIESTKRSIFQPSVVALNTRSTTSTRISDIYLDYGMQYAFIIDTLRGRDLKENVKWIFGATFTTEANVRAKVDTLTYSYYYGSSGEEILRDTIKQSTDSKGRITFPLSFGFGLGFKKGDRWFFTTDFALQNWSSYQAFNSVQGLKNSMRISAGVQYIPNSKYVASKNSLSGYGKRINYRAGVRYFKTAIELKNTQLKEYAVSLGVGLPVGRNYLLRNFSMINIGLELGQRGTTSNGLIRENFLKASVGFTINDLWFQKARID